MHSRQQSVWEAPGGGATAGSRVGAHLPGAIPIAEVRHFVHVLSNGMGAEFSYEVFQTISNNISGKSTIIYIDNTRSIFI